MDIKQQQFDIKIKEELSKTKLSTQSSKFLLNRNTTDFTKTAKGRKKIVDSTLSKKEITSSNKNFLAHCGQTERMYNKTSLWASKAFSPQNLTYTRYEQNKKNFFLSQLDHADSTNIKTETS